MAGFNINEFRAKGLLSDGARPNLFEVELNTSNLSVPQGNIDEKIRFLARASQLPEDNIGMISVPYFGREIKVAGNRTFGEWTLTVINDEDFRIRNAVEEWMSGINSHIANIRRSDFADIGGTQSSGYTCDGVVTQFGKSGNEIKKYVFVGAWPMNLSAIELDWASNDAIEEYAITFAYQWWESDTTDRTGASSRSRISSQGNSILPPAGGAGAP